MFIPKKGSHPLADATSSKLSHDKKLMNISGGNVAEPGVTRSDESEACDRTADLCQIRPILTCPDRGRVMGITSVGSGIEVKPLRHVVAIVLEQISQQGVRFGSDSGDREIRERQHGVRAVCLLH